MKGEGKMLFKSRMKWVGLVGLVLSVFSLFTHFLLARYTERDASEYQASITIFSWRPVFENADLSITSPLYRRLWGPVRQLEPLYPYANPRGNYAAPALQTNGFIFARIRGGFHEIRNSICDVVVVSRLLNATLVIPEILSTTSSKGISSEFKSFPYLYNEDEFVAALAKDVRIVKSLPKNLKGARRKKEIPMFKVSYSTSPNFYLQRVLPVLNRHSVVELVVSDGGCLQAVLPPHLEEFQRLRCRVAFHALRFRQEVQDLATRILNRLRAPGRPFIAYEPGMTRDALAYYGCAELFQHLLCILSSNSSKDVHTELIQHRRSWMIKRGIVKGNLSVNSAEQRLNGLCPLMPEEVGILLRAYGYSWDTIIYISGGEVFGGQKKLIPLHGMFENVVDRTTLSTSWELSRIYGHEANLIDKYPRTPSFAQEEMKLGAWKNSRPRPRPLPPPPARPKYYNIEGWWGWVAESDNEPETTVEELRMNAHKLLWEAIDYTICVEADAFIPGFDSDGKGRPNFASLVMGHRLYESAASKTYRPDRREVTKLLEEIRDHLYQANRTWITSVRRHLRISLLKGLKNESTRSKPLSFLSHPLPECCCWSHKETPVRASSPSTESQVRGALGVQHRCPAWMDSNTISQSKDSEREREENLDEEDPASSGIFFRHSDRNHGGGEINIKEEAQIEDQEELEGAER
ncbi:O-fucosyltransferase 27 isoform X2 [Diospyros lotus]|uniref:O-fucosyltransferase 27 isoform X2 n=1 Tax=Diospyros lotus TaxID=55363 RepID=UPI0022565B55|nr:O-fucosyltransferase 27 isoform X2 [Diospyros lotus]